MNRLFPSGVVVGVVMRFFLSVCTAAPVASASWKAYSREHAIALDGPQDSRRLLPYLESAELVLLGETTHGTREYYVWRAELSKALIQENGFQFIVVEGDWSSIDRLDRYVRHRCREFGSAEAVLKTFDRWPVWMWANPVIAELAEWLHAYNAERAPAQRVGVHGMDVYGWGESARKLPVYLDRMDPGWAARASPGLEGVQRFGGDPAAFYQAVLRGESTGMETLQDIQATLERLKMESPAPCREAWLQAMQHASLLVQAKRHLRKNMDNHPRSWNPRAEHFIQTVRRLRTYYGVGARGIVWAHNTHIGDARYTPMRPAGLVTIGQQAREWLGEDRVFLLGFASDRGSFRAGPRWGSPGRIMAMPTAEPGTFNAWLRDSLGASAFLPLAAARQNPELLKPAGHRAVGVVYEPGTPMHHHYVPSIIPHRYDGVLYLRNTRSLAELD